MKEYVGVALFVVDAVLVEIRANLVLNADLEEARARFVMDTILKEIRDSFALSVALEETLAGWLECGDVSSGPSPVLAI